MRLSRAIIIGVSFSLGATGCISRLPIKVTLPSIPKGGPHVIPAKVANAVLSKNLVDPIALVRLTIGIGSGLRGYQSAGLNRDGTVEVVLLDPSDSRFYITTSANIDPNSATSLLKSHAIVSSLSLQPKYTVGILDGTQGFLHLVTESEEIFVWCDNTFPPDVSDAGHLLW